MAQLNGTNGNDTLTGTAFFDTLIGYEGDDLLLGNGSNDSLNGGDGNDTLLGGVGRDILEGGPGDDLLDGGASDDAVSYDGSASSVTVDLTISTAQNTGGAGIDTIISVNAVIGSQFDDVLIGAASETSNLLGGSGNDSLYGGAGYNILMGGAGDDMLDGSAGRDMASYTNSLASVNVDLSLTGPQHTGGDGIDTLLNIEEIQGSFFDDNLSGDAGNNYLSGGPGGNDILQGGDGNDTLLGETGFDTLDGGAGDDVLFGGEGSDLFVDGPGNDYMDNEIPSQLIGIFPGSGISLDFVSYSNSAAGVTIDLSINTAQNTGGGGIDTLVNFKAVIGSDFDDVLLGNLSSNIMMGGAGNDALHGDAGMDTLVGSLGTDTLTGGTGSDYFAFNLLSAPGAGPHVITDFSADSDKLLLWGSVLSDLDGGMVSAGNFIAGAGVTEAVDADDVLIYNSSTGELFYDADGTGDVAAVSLALLLGVPNLQASDFAVGAAFTYNLTGSELDDRLYAGAVGSYFIGGGAGNDSLEGWTGDDVLEGNTGADRLYGGTGNNTLLGGTGSDLLVNGSGNDYLDGGHDPSSITHNLVAHTNVNSGVVIDLSVTTAQNTGGGGIDTFINIQAVFGSTYADVLIGDASGNILAGGPGNDSLHGGDGNDTLLAILGVDTLTGGDGADHFVLFLDPPVDNGIHVIGDFETGSDKLLLWESTEALFADGLVKTENFITGAGVTTAVDADDFLIYNTSTGELFFDKDGNGAAVALPLAMLPELPALQASDFVFGRYNFFNLTGTSGNDRIYAGFAGNYSLEGAAGNDTLEGSIGNDILQGQEGVDFLIGGYGNDLLEGGADIDTAMYSFQAEYHQLIWSAQSWTLVAPVGTEGIDTLQTIEHIQFLDKNVDISSKAHESYANIPDELWQFFIVAFSGAPGVVYMDQLQKNHNNGMSVQSFVNIFVTKAQFRELYPVDLSQEQFARQLVDNVVQDSALQIYKDLAVQEILNQFASGKTLGQVIYTSIGKMAKLGEQSLIWGNTARLFNNQVKVAKFYTDTMSQSTTDTATLRSIIANVDYDMNLDSEAVLIELIGSTLLGLEVV